MTDGMGQRPLLPRGTRTSDACLPAVLPDDAESFAVHNDWTRQVLQALGADVDAARPVVEIGPIDRLTGAATWTVAVIDRSAPEDLRSTQAVALRRVAAAAHLRRELVRARRLLARHHGGDVLVLTWERGQSLHVPGVTAHNVQRRLVNRIPQRAYVIAADDLQRPTLLVRTLDDARNATGAAFRRPLALIRSGQLVMVGDDLVVRVALGPGRRRLESNSRNLQTLAARLDHRAARLVPTSVAQGSRGLATWTVESRSDGTKPRLPLDTEIVEQCLDFLTALHRADGGAREPITAAAEVIAALCPGADEVCRIAEIVDEQLWDVPHGYGHGDLSAGNLMVDAGRLVGVIDWDSGGPGRPPLVDLLHLRLHDGMPVASRWGRRIVTELLPWAEGGGDAQARAYCRGIGAPCTPRHLRAIVYGYWLQRLAYQLQGYADRVERTRWLQRSVFEVLGTRPVDRLRARR